MFNIEQQISGWRNQLANNEGLLPENINELEDHLRESIALLVEQTLSDEEAFLVSIRRIGTNAELSQEFRKVNGDLIWLQRSKWMIYGFLFFQIVFGFWSLFAETLGRYTMLFSSSALVGIILNGMVFALLPLGIWFGTQNVGQEHVNWQGRFATFFRAITRRQKTFLGLVIAALMIQPCVQIAMQIVTARVIPINKIGEYQAGLAVYSVAAAFILPIFWLCMLVWLNRQKRILLVGNLPV